MSFFKTIPLLASISILAACAGDAPKNIAADRERVAQANQSLQGRAAIRAGGAQISEGVFVGATRANPNAGAALPARLRSSGAVTLQARNPMNAVQILTRLSEITDVPHVAEFGPEGEVQIDTARIIDVAELNAGIQGGALGEASDITMRPNLRGSLPEVLDRVASHFSLDWAYENGRIVFRDYVTRDYQIATFASAISGTSSVGSGAVSSSTTYSVDFLTELRESLASVAGPEATINIGPSTGIATVNTTLRRHARVREHLARFNESTNVQIAFDVNVVTVSRADNTSGGINLTGALTGARSTIDFGSASEGGVNVAISRGSLNVDAAINALATVGEVSVETRTGATTLNNRPVPIEVVEDISYAASTQIERSAEDPSSSNVFTSVTPGTVTVGYQMQLLPRVLNNRDIQVQYTIELSDASFRRFPSGDGTEIELPEVSRTTFEQQALVENGQTIVLAGFERRRNAANTTAGLVSLSGSGDVELASTVIFITPRILERRTPVGTGATN